MVRRIVVTLVTLTSLLFLTTGVQANSHGSHPRTWVVDIDGLATPKNCNDLTTPPSSTSINGAILLASPGDKIIVCPGTYTEQVTVDKALQLTGFTRQLNWSACVASTGGIDSTRDTILNGQIDVKAGSVTVEHFTVQGATEDLLAGTGGAGINVGSPAQNSVKLRQNVIQNNVFGVYLNGDRDEVSGSCIRNNITPGAASSNGIYSDQGLTRSSIKSNTFTGHGGNAAVLLIGNLVSLIVNSDEIDHNRAVNDGPFMVVGATNVEVEGNYSTGSATNGIQIDIPDLPTSSNIRVEDNTIRNCGYSGIQLFGTTYSFVRDNSVRLCVDRGITLREGLTGGSLGANWNTLYRNDARSNGWDGFYAVASSHDNTLLKNKARDNNTLATIDFAYDCNDQSVGLRTAGTDNTWVMDSGLTFYPVGICAP